MEIRINKNLLLPIAIIIVALLVGGVLLLFDKPKQKPIVSSAQTQQTNKTGDKQQISANARALELSVPGMFCAGCMASVEGYLSSIPGVEWVEARLTPTKSARVIYSPDKITKEEIVKNQIFDTYGPATVISDDVFQGSAEQLNQIKIDVPPSIQEKTNRVSELLIQKQRRGVDTAAIKKQLDEVDYLLSSGKYQQVESMLDRAIAQLEQL